MKKVGKPVFFIVTVLIVALTYLSFFGFSTMYGDSQKTVIKGAKDIRFGIDIKGGVDASFSPPNGFDATNDQMRQAEAVIKTRLVSKNINDYEVYTDYNKDRIIVRFPWKSDEKEFNPETAIKELGETALLTFREEPSGQVPTQPNGTLVLQGKDVKNASAVMQQDETGTSQPAVKLELSSDGAKSFASATSRLAGTGSISIWMDNTLISSPRVKTAIPDGVAFIDNMTAKEASDLADKINAGALPFKLEIDSFSSINPTLGQGSLKAMLLAGVIAFLLVSLFMLIYYRLPGFVAVIALLGQVAGSLAAVSGFFAFVPSFTLTLPGIAGIILSIGMGVDANVITSERIKEELRTGRSIEGAIDAGSKNSFSAIFDGNITVIIVAIILMGVFGPPSSIWSKLLTPFLFMFGPSTTGAVYSFGFTLLVGVIFNFVMGVTLSGWMRKSLARFKIFKNRKFYCGGVGK